MRQSAGDFMQAWIYEHVTPDTDADDTDRLASKCEAAARSAGFTPDEVVDEVGADIRTLVSEAIVNPD